jgi:Protein of unknown function (DUF3551)
MVNSNRSPQLARTAMRLGLALGAVVMIGALDAATPARAQGAWCAYYSGPSGGTNCGFYTYGQCRAAISGVGGFCSPSPYARFSDYPPPRRKLRRQYRY